MLAQTPLPFLSPASGAVSRADLLRILILTDSDCLHSVAELGAYQAPEKQQISLTLPELPAIPVQEASSEQEKPAKQEIAPEAPVYFYRIVERTVSDLSPPPKRKNAPLPDWYQAIPALDLGSVERPRLEPPEKAPIVPWSRLWPVLYRLLSELKRSKHADIPRLTKMLANGEMPLHIPRKCKQSWSAQVQLLVDRPERTALFNADYNKLLRQLQKLRGETGLEILQIIKQPGGAVRLRVHETYRSEQWRLPEAGTAIVILSDLGLLERSGAALQEWLNFGKRLRAAGFTPLALLPLPQRYLNRELIALFDCICWTPGNDLHAVRWLPSPNTDWEEPLQQDGKHKALEVLAWLGCPRPYRWNRLYSAPCAAGLARTGKIAAWKPRSGCMTT